MSEVIDICLDAQQKNKEVTIFTANREYCGKVLTVMPIGIALVDPYILYREDGQRFRCQDFYIPLAHIEAAGVLEE